MEYLCVHLIAAIFVGFSTSLPRDQRDVDSIWENGVVPYVIDDSLHPAFKDLVFEAFAHFHERTCVRFVEREDETDYLIFQSLGGCWSSIGRKGGPQKLSLAGNCDTLGTVLHEIMHALGFHHEQSRTDRDEYITIIWDNIVEDEKHNFEKYEHVSERLGAPYDYMSVMHYSSKAYSSNDKPTIIAKDDDVQLIDRNYFSKWDLFKINKLYNCGMTGLEKKLLPGSGECYEDGKSLDYRGTVSETRRGKTCQNWFSFSPHNHPFSDRDKDQLTLAEWGLGDHNYCRNPDKDSRGAWCYTTDPDVRYDFCDIGSPGEYCAAPAESVECYREPNGNDYRGTVSTTYSGEPCISWADSGWAPYTHNYCRNRGNDYGAWCLTASGFGYCDIGRPYENCL